MINTTSKTWSIKEVMDNLDFILFHKRHRERKKTNYRLGENICQRTVIQNIQITYKTWHNKNFKNILKMGQKPEQTPKNIYKWKITCSTSYVFREIRVKTVRCHYIAIGMDEIH